MNKEPLAHLLQTIRTLERRLNRLERMQDASEAALTGATGNVSTTGAPVGASVAMSVETASLSAAAKGAIPAPHTHNYIDEDTLRVYADRFLDTLRWVIDVDTYTIVVDMDTLAPVYDID